MRTCSVVGCRSLNRNSKAPLFKVQAEDTLSWITAVRKAINQTKELKYICYEHFSPNNIHTKIVLPNDVTLVNRYKKR